MSEKINGHIMRIAGFLIPLLAAKASVFVFRRLRSSISFEADGFADRWAISLSRFIKMVISWRGYGLLGFLPPLLAALMASLFSSGMDAPEFTKIFQACLFLLSIGIWFFGKHLNADAQADDAPHMFMRLRLQNAGFIWIALLVFYFFAS